MITWRHHVLIDSSHGMLQADTAGVRGRDRLVRATPSPAYEQSILHLLNRIASNRVGNIVLTQVTARGRRVRIIPRVDLSRHLPSTPASTSLGNVADAYAAGVRARDGEHGEHDLGVVGTGRGHSQALISFSPGFRAPASLEPFYADDSAMVHEFFHVLRSVAGRTDHRGINTRHHNIEEFGAILVENIYRSATGRHRLRESHLEPVVTAFDDRTRVGREDANDLFRRIYAAPLALFRQQELALCAALATVDARFNPLRN